VSTKAAVSILAGLVILIGLAAAFLFVASPRLSTPGAEKLTVAASIFPVADIARQVSGEHAVVHVIIPPGVSEHSFELTPQRLAELQRASVIFQIGHGLDDQLVGRITGALPQVRTITVDRGITLREFAAEDEHAEEEEEHAHDSGTDPHYYLTVPNGSVIATTVAETLSELDPAHAADFQKNLQRYQEQLGAAEQELQATARNLPRKEFIAMHNAWSYFADQYGLRLVDTYEPVEGREPTLSDLAHLREVIEQFGLTTFFAEPQKASSADVSFMQREFGLKILTLDPAGGLAETGSFIDLMRFNMQSIAEGG